MARWHRILLIGLLVALSEARGADDALFRDRVAPIFERRCVGCHGEAAPKGKLTLSTAEGLRRGGASGPAVVPGKPEESLLLEVISGEKPEMPRAGAPLSRAEVGTVREWVERGAHWPGGMALRDRRFEGESWWAFRPLVRPKVPKVNDRAWPRTPIDAFVLERLEREGLAPGPEADRRTLVRRLSYDLVGLPPTPEEIDAFLDDPAPDAYEKVVDRLLASPRYGERWGRHWLDVVHYGDTHGYDKDKRRDHAWPYRDYVIESLNEDLPYARFVADQVAGDVLRPGDPRGIVATGFIAAGPWDFVGHVELREGTVDKAKARLNDRDDMLANAMSSFQGLTVHCARCHDHKFDPIPQRDYYRLQAVFAGVERGDRPYLGRESLAKAAALGRRKADLVARRAALSAEVGRKTTPELARLGDELAALRGRLAALPDPSDSAPSPTNGYHSGIAASPDVEKWVQVDLGRAFPIDEVRLVPARPVDFPDTPGFGFPVRFRVALAGDAASSDATIVADHASADFANPGDHPVVIQAGRREARFVRVSASRLWPRTNDYVFALGELEVLSGGEDVAAKADVSALDSIEAGRWGRAHLVDGFDSRSRLADASDPSDLARERRALRTRVAEVEARHKALKDALVGASTRVALEQTESALAGVEHELRAVLEAERVYAAVPRPPRPIHRLRRGDVEQPAEPVGPGALSCLPGLESDFSSVGSEDEGARRAALAGWLASPGNVLTWRSIVNRAWHYHFGRGLVDTPNDFGRNGSRPTHPELLDWLAVEFLERGGSLKALHRLIVRSAAYRQSARHDAKAEAIDADNRWLWRADRRRLDAESIRDAVLAVGGTLDSRMGGPGFELFRYKDDHSPVYDHADPSPELADGPRVRRRTVYRFVVRSVPNPFLESLDCADPNLNTPARATTITALQALALLNDRFMVRQSQAFARRLEGLEEVPGRRIDRAYLLALGRPPRPEERAALAEHASRHGLANACLVLLNTSEFLFID